MLPVTHFENYEYFYYKISLYRHKSISLRLVIIVIIYCELNEAHNKIFLQLLALV